MSGTILTPNTIWNNFSVPHSLGAEYFNERTIDGVKLKSVHIEGRKVGDETVQIYGLFALAEGQSLAPAILLIQDFLDSENERLIIDLAKKGFNVLSIDVAGEKEGKDNFTLYPERISYANYEKAKDGLYSIKGDAKSTCWYEWVAVARYALKFLKGLTCVTKVGGFGVAEAATILWQVAAMDESIACAVFALNAGWAGYRGINKFGGKIEPQFSDDMYKFIAGIEPQAYAMHVKCPTMLLSATNNKIYDVDRAYDTVSRIDGKVYKAVHYSIGYRERISSTAYSSACTFLEKFLSADGNGISLPSEIDVRCELIGGEIKVFVKADKKGMRKIELFVAEEMIDPAMRCWERRSDYKEENGEFVFTLSPYHLSEIVTMFVRAKYKNGFEICSNVIAKRFSADEVKHVYPSNIIYSSRIEHAESIFSAAHQPADGNNEQINVSFKNRIVVKKGPMGIEGVYSKFGLLSFKMAEKKYKPMDGAMLMFDVYAKDSGEVTVKLINDYLGKYVVYTAKVKAKGGDVWQNVQLEANKFKTAEGMTLKTYDGINAIEFNVDGVEFLINNALWV